MKAMKSLLRFACFAACRQHFVLRYHTSNDGVFYEEDCDLKFMQE